MNKIIAISGLKGSGKNTIAEMIMYLLNTPKIFHNYFCYQHKNLILNHNKYQIVAFADSIKEMLGSLLNIDKNKFEHRDFKENWFVNLSTLSLFPRHIVLDNEILSDSKFTKLAKSWNPEYSNSYLLSIRQLMQLFGTEIMRNYISDKIWINNTLRKSLNKNIIISDLRFIVEYEEIKKHNGLVIYVNRDLKPGPHKSESEMQTLLDQNKFDLIIDNKDITLKQLFNKIKNIKL